MRTENGEKRAKEARAAYQRENMKTLAANVRKETAEKFKDVAGKNGKAPARILREYVEIVCETGDASASYGDSPTTVRLTEKNFNRLYHETSFNNPKHLNPDELVNDILARYFKLADELRAK